MSMSHPTTVTENPEASRYEIFVNGSLAGFSAYRDTESDVSPQRILHHTEVSEEYAGQGLAAILTREAVSATIAGGRHVVPMCPYVKRWVAKHNVASDGIDPVSSAHRALFD